MAICKICGFKVESFAGLAAHIQVHKVKSKEYYDIYLKGKNEDICSLCKKKTKYISLNKGYKKFCSECNIKLGWEKLSKQKKGKTREEIYSKEGLQKQKDAEEKRREKGFGVSKRKGKTYEEIYGEERAEEVKRNLSESHKGISQTKETRDKHSLTMKRKILSGEWSPNIHNNFTHWQSEVIVDGKVFKFRSTWEVEVFEQLKDVYPLSEIEYETLRIPYKYDGIEHIYIVDFYIPLKRLAIEVKPTNSLFDKQEQEKIRVCKEFCKQNNMIFVIFNEKNKYSVREVLDSLGLSEVKKIRISKWTELICGSKQIKLI